MGGMKDTLGDTPYEPPRALARTTDPATSHAAAASMADTLPELEAVVFRQIERAGDRGVTLDEIIDATGLDKVTASPRMRPLVNKGLIEAAGSRMGKARRRQIIWKARCVG